MFFKAVFLHILLLIANIEADGYETKSYVEDDTLQKIEKKYDSDAKNRFINLQSKLDSVKDESVFEKLDVVNKFYNEVKYASDIDVYNLKDYWATPLEFLSRYKGDCEDYVISKYFALKYLNVDKKKLFFTYVRSTKFKTPHMVLTYFETPTSEPLILDNTTHTISSASQRKDLTPIYNFNGEHFFKAAKTGAGKKLKHKPHKKWEQLKQNMKRNKI